MSDQQSMGFGPPTRWITRVDPFSRPDPLIMGDSGAWTSYIPAMWGAIADPTGAHAYPDPPRPDSDLDSAIAYWAPLPHLLLYSLGWRSTNRSDSDRSVMGKGLIELLDSDLAYLPQDPRLAFMMEVWGPDELRDFAYWAASDGDLDDAGGRPAKWYSIAGRAFDGGTDALHLADHWTSPMGSPHSSARLPVPNTWTDTEADPPTATLLLDAYAGWAKVLEDFGNSLPVPRSGRSWRVEVVIRRIGWLGQFRRSRDTGLWFAGGHLIHALAHS